MQLRIEKLVYGGDGLARIDSNEGRKKSVFVPLVLPGEEVEATITEERPGFARAQLERVLQPSPERTEPPCPYFGECGGCHYQHTTYENQLGLKKQILHETVARIAKIELPAIETHPSPPLGYRNRTRMKLEPGGTGKFQIGYYRLGSHRLLLIRECPISSPLINRALQVLWSLSVTHEFPAGLSEVEFFVTDGKLLVEFLVERDSEQLMPFAVALQTELPELAGIAALPRQCVREEQVAAPELSGETERSSRALAGDQRMSYKVGESEYRVSAGSFFQTNRFLTETLVSLATAGRSGRLALDLYAGVGLFTLPLAKTFDRVTAVESAPVSFSDLQINAPANVKPVNSSTDACLTRTRGPKPDFVLVDPPRAGLGKKVVEALARLKAPQLTYVSCDPSTLARDLPSLLASGYRISQAHLVDLFPQTFHIETVLQLDR